MFFRDDSSDSSDYDGKSKNPTGTLGRSNKFNTSSQQPGQGKVVSPPHTKAPASQVVGGPSSSAPGSSKRQQLSKEQQNIRNEAQQRLQQQLKEQLRAQLLGSGRQRHGDRGAKSGPESGAENRKTSSSSGGKAKERRPR